MEPITCTTCGVEIVNLAGTYSIHRLEEHGFLDAGADFCCYGCMKTFVEMPEGELPNTYVWGPPQLP